MSIHLDRGRLLLERSRFDDAATELRQELAINPENAAAHSLLALTLMAQEKTAEALEEAQAGVGLAPARPFSHYTLAVVLTQMERYAEASIAIREAIAKDPEEADFYKVLGQIHLQQKQWEDALSAAEQGLNIDPENVGCQNLRAIALIQLGRRAEAGATLETALARDPENAITHANRGWALLHEGQPKQAMLSFQEALRIDPEQEWARYGIVEALKARNPLYRVLLGYFLWMSRLKGRAQWAIILGAFFAFRIVRSIAASTPALRPYLEPLLYLYLTFALLTWVARPLFDLLLRINRFGRLALPPDRVVASNWIGACILAAIAFVVGGLLTGGQMMRTALFVAGGQSLAMMVPVASVFSIDHRRPKMILTAYAAVLAGVVLIGLVTAAMGQSFWEWFSFFLLGWVAFTWVANIIKAMD